MEMEVLSIVALCTVIDSQQTMQYRLQIKDESQTNPSDPTRDHIIFSTNIIMIIISFVN